MSYRKGSDYITATEWLKTEGLDLDHSDMVKYTTIASRLYEETYLVKPPHINRPASTGKSRNNRVRGYLKEYELWVLEKAWVNFCNKTQRYLWEVG